MELKKRTHLLFRKSESKRFHHTNVNESNQFELTYGEGNWNLHSFGEHKTKFISFRTKSRKYNVVNRES